MNPTFCQLDSEIGTATQNMTIRKMITTKLKCKRAELLFHALPSESPERMFPISLELTQLSLESLVHSYKVFYLYCRER